MLFANLTGAPDQFSRARLETFAGSLGLDQDEFNRCLRSGQFRNEVRQDASFALNRGIAATPTFFINGERIEGAQPFDIFQAVIERKLAEAGG